MADDLHPTRFSDDPTTAVQLSAAPESLSRRFWGLDLAAGLPRVLTSDGVEACRGDIATAIEFIASEFPATAEVRSLSERAAATKRKFLHEACDVIELRHQGRCVGAMVGAPEDWSSYYIRCFGIHPRYQRWPMTRRFMQECIFEPLRRCGVERVNAETPPWNLALARRYCELHFYVTGQIESDRWGTMLRYTHFLDPECERTFHERCSRRPNPAG